MTAAAPRPDVTIFADASFCPRTHVAGWAAWMKGNGKASATVGGKLGMKVNRSYDAETFAAVNALYAARSLGYFSAGQTVMLQSDCLHALHVIHGFVPNVTESKHPDGLPLSYIRHSRLKANDHKAIQTLRALVAETPIKILVRHVRGHQDGHGRAWVNEQCDRMAKRHMRDARHEARA